MHNNQVERAPFESGSVAISILCQCFIGYATAAVVVVVVVVVVISIASAADSTDDDIASAATWK